MEQDEVMVDRTALFLLSAITLAYLGWSSKIPISSTVPRAAFSLTLSYLTARALWGWAFPQHMHGTGHKEATQSWYFNISWMFSAVSAVLAVLVVQHASQAKASAAGQWLFSVSCVAPPVALALCLLEERLDRDMAGILWVAAAQQATIAMCVALAEHSRELSARGRGRLGLEGERSKKDSSRSSAMRSSAAALGFFWAVLASICTPRALADLNIPLFSLLMLCSKGGVLAKDTHPASISALLSAGWWLFSVFFDVFIRSATDWRWKSSGWWLGLFRESHVSFAASSSFMVPVVTILLALAPLPAIYCAFMQRRDQSHNFMFVFTIMGGLSILCGSVLNVKLLGLMGIVWGFKRCWEINLWSEEANKRI